MVKLPNTELAVLVCKEQGSSVCVRGGENWFLK